MMPIPRPETPPSADMADVSDPTLARILAAQKRKADSLPPLTPQESVGVPLHVVLILAGAVVVAVALAFWGV